MTDRVAAVYSLGPDVDEWTIQKAWDKPDQIVGRFTELAYKAIEVGADVIIPAEGVITEFIYSLPKSAKLQFLTASEMPGNTPN